MIKKILTLLLAFGMCVSLVACSSKSSEKTTATEDEQSIYSEEFMAACADTNIDVEKIKNWEQMDDWTNGERFRFSYKRHPFVVNVNYDGTINSITLGGSIGTKIFLRGYVPYDVEDYLVDEDMAISLIPYAEDTVKMALNYPSTADFSALQWSYGREGNLYQLQSKVKAKNAFGVKEEFPFKVIFDTGIENKIKCVYLELGGVVVDSELSDKPEREKIELPEKSSEAGDGEIRLVYGEFGEYGKQDPKYPDFIDYYIPAGKYSAKNVTKNSVIMIIDNPTNEDTSRVSLGEGESDEFEIGDDQHIELVYYSDVILTRIED